MLLYSIYEHRLSIIVDHRHVSRWTSATEIAKISLDIFDFADIVGAL